MNKDTLRLGVTAAFAFAALLLYQKWEQFGAGQHERMPEQTSSAPSSGTAAMPDGYPHNVEKPVLTQQLGDGRETERETPASHAGNGAAENNTEIVASIDNNAVRAGISSDGSIVRLELLRHLTEKKTDPLPLLNVSGNRRYIANSGLLGEGLPTHGDPGWQTSKPVGNSVISSWSGNNARVRMTHTLAERGYISELKYEVGNTGAAPITVHAYFQFLRDTGKPDNYSSLTPSFYGAVIYTEQDKFNKHDFDDMKSYPAKASDGWIGIVERYFLSAWLDSGEIRENYMRNLPGGDVAIGIIRPLGVIQPGQTETLTQPLFIGALEQDLLKEIEPDVGKGIALAVDYGWLTLLAAPLFVLLEVIEKGVGNWGVAILLLTLLVKLAFYPLSAASFRSMAKMKKLAPKIQQIKERHGSDKEAFQKAVMQTYRNEKVNPLGGCLPILIQIPVFIALYWVLLGSVELRHAPFALWIDDLSVPDPYYVLPLLLGAAMVLQTRLNPVPPDPTQAMIIKIMPIGFAIFSVFFPAGLVLYWIANTALSMLQQWHVSRSVQSAGVKNHARKPKK